MSSSADSANLPRPFYEDWPAGVRPAAQALWEWHVALEAKGPSGVPEAVAAAAREACRAHGLPGELLERQADAARRFEEPLRFATAGDVSAFVHAWVHPHGRLLARLGGVTGTWQLPLVDQMSAGFFWVGRLAYLRRDLERDRLFLPADDLEQFGVTLDQLREGRLDEGVRRLLWKQTIRARDALAQGGELVRDLERRPARAMKRWWFGGLEVLNEIQRRDFDVWSEPVSVSLRHRLQVRFQALFGRTSFR